MAQPQVSRFRWAFRYSLQSLLILTLVVAAFFGGRASMQPDFQKQLRYEVELQAKIRETEKQLALEHSHRLVLEMRLHDAQAAFQAWQKFGGQTRTDRAVLLGSPEAWQQFRQ